MKERVLNTASILGIVLLSSFSVNAQGVSTGECTCVTAPTNGSSDTLGKITQTNGDVLNSGVTGFEKAAANDPLHAGSQMSISTLSTANITVGTSCDLYIPQNSEVHISQPAGPGTKICVKVSEEPVVAASTPNGLVVIIPAAIALGIGLNSASD